jgi:RND family efflux transporter MFP subunit
MLKLLSGKGGPVMKRAIGAVLIMVGSVACGGNDPAQGAGPGGGMPPSVVKTLTIKEQPTPRSSEFVATIQSLRSTTIQPQVEGLVTRIFVKSGDVVRAGSPLVQIDPDRQTAAVSSLEAARVARQADVAYAEQQLQRAKTLLEAGAVSRQELDQAETTHKTATAQLAAVEAQIQESRVELNYYRVTALTAGVVGDIPIRVGDRVTTSTVITTIDEKGGLEAHIAVPLEEATRLKLGLPVELMDATGNMIVSSKVTFIAPRADDATQSVLVKALIPPGTSLRVLQYVRARVVWSTDLVLVVPVVAVNRVSGTYFCFVAEAAENGFVARQRPVQVGEVFGDNYVVRSGLESGDRVIVSGIQKIGDGMPVKPEETVH